MKRIVFIGLLSVFALSSCSSDNHTFNNPNLLNIKFQFNVNTALPQFNPLKFTGNPVYVDGYGNGGVLLINVGNQIRAYDAGDPNHPFDTQCSVMQIHGQNVTCQCQDHNTYSLFSGTVIEDESDGDDYEYTMLEYRVLDNGNGTYTIRN